MYCSMIFPKINPLTTYQSIIHSDSIKHFLELYMIMTVTMICDVIITRLSTSVTKI